MPHHEEFKKAGQGALVLMAAIVVFLVAVRFAGGAVAAFARKTIGVGSKKLAEQVAEKILEFREGLRTIKSFGQFALALGLSLLVWMAIAGSYFETTRAFRDSAQLANFSVPQTMLLLASSMAGSLIQLPVIGWFSQIGILAGAYLGFFSVPVEIASAGGAVLMAVTTLGVVPAGLIAARIEGVNLRDVARNSEAVSTT
jgi:ABC-type multidrug transport system fused ATPase/permease subunit